MRRMFRRLFAYGAPKGSQKGVQPAAGTADTSRRKALQLGVEGLENRLNLSTLSVLSARHPVPEGAGAALVQTTGAPQTRYRIDALSAGVGTTYGATWINPLHSDAQEYFNKRRKKGGGGSNTTAPTTPAAPATPVNSSLPVTITQTAEGKYTRVTITGSSDNDSIVVSQAGSTLTIVANGQTSTVSGNFAELAIYGEDGNDTITVQSSVNIASLLYGGSGNNAIVAGGSAKSYIVTIGAGVDTLTGNGSNTSFWADPGDTVHASAAEVNNGGVHKVTAFYQPFTTNTSSGSYIPMTLDGQNLKDPTDSGATVRLTASLWGAGPAMTDVNQGGVGDCYYLASLQSMALKAPGRLQELAVDLGDGTYAVEFKRGGMTSYVRVDGDLPAGGWGGLEYAHPVSGGAIWVAIMEKAYAYFRTGGNTYNSLNSGWTGAALSDLGVATTTFSTSGAAGTLFNQIATGLASGKVEAAVTFAHTPAGSPIIGSHAYSIVSATVESGTQYITVRNPWGIDGAGNDGNPNDGLVKLTVAQFVANFTAGSISV